MQPRRTLATQCPRPTINAGATSPAQYLWIRHGKDSLLVFYHAQLDEIVFHVVLANTIVSVHVRPY